jgi:WD40 repeat protein
VIPFLPSEAAAQRLAIYAAAIAPDGKALATASAFLYTPGNITFRDLTTGKERFVYKGHTDAVKGLVFSADGKMLASGDNAGAIRVWSTETGKILTTFTPSPGRVSALAFSPDGRMMASSSSANQVILSEVSTGRQRAVIDIEGKGAGQSGGCCVAFSPDGRTLACAADCRAVDEDPQRLTVRLYDVNTCKERAVLTGHIDKVTDIAFDPNGRILATTSWDKSVRLWDAATGRQKAILRGHKGEVMAVVFTTDGRMLASWCSWQQKKGQFEGNILYGSELKIWEVATGMELCSREPDEAKVNSPRVAFAMQFVGSKELLNVRNDLSGVDRLDIGREISKTPGG